MAARTIIDALDSLRLDRIEELADMNASYWRSIGEASARGERLTIETHRRQVRLATIAAFEIIKSLGTPAEQEVAAQ
jgi:hypothetical protein